MGHPFNSRPSLISRGFTLIEMLIVLAIIVVVTAIAIGGQSGFDRTLTLNNAAYGVALTLREAQTYGLSSRTYTGIRNTGYGVSFRSATPSAYVLFADTCLPVSANAKPDDKPGNDRYDSPLLTGCTGTELVSTYSLNNGFSVENFCVFNTSDAATCSSTGAIDGVDIKFERPEANAIITSKNGSAYNSTFVRACLRLVSPSGDKRSVFVSETGQVAVTNNGCPV